MTDIVLMNREELAAELEKYRSLLAHKPEIAHWLIGEALADGTLGVEGAVAVRGGEFTGSVTLFHHGGVGLIGNVFVQESERGRGLGSALMDAVDGYACEHGHEAHVLWVNPAKRPAAYRLYLRSGFEPQGGTGLMIKRYAATSPKLSGPLRAVPLAWRHMPELNLLTSEGSCGTLISYLFHCVGFATFEMEFLHAMREEGLGRWALEDREGRLHGAVFLRKDPLWEQQADAAYHNTNHLFDVIVREEAAPGLAECLRGLDWPAGRFVTYAEEGSPKAQALAGLFSCKAQLPAHIRWQGRPVNLSMLTFDAA